MTKVTPVILSGGSGTRLWPASRSKYPKQLLPLVEEQTMLQATANRVRSIPNSSENLMIVSNETHRFSVADQMASIDTDSQIILEPEGRNTAPAVALAALHADQDEILLITPADHVISNVSEFQAAIANAMPAALDGKLVAFGIRPTSPETGYGYLKAKPVGDAPVPVEAFVEKPDIGKAKQYCDSGEYFWNSGMFMFRASAILTELKRFAPGILDNCRNSMQAKSLDRNFVRPDSNCFAACAAESIDRAVMEKSANVVMVPLDAGWSDVGSWSALHDVCDRDSDGNTLLGDALAIDCSGTFVQSESRLVGAVGLSNVLIVESRDAVLVADKDRTQEVKMIVDRLKEEGRDEAEIHRKVFRPWGSYDSLEIADNFQVKRLIIKPGAVLSLQRHSHRSEHWVVVHGKVEITKNDDVFELGVNESTYVAIGDIHRIANPFDKEAHLIEVQCGEYLGEDDIERLEDHYGREGTTA